MNIEFPFRFDGRGRTAVTAEDDHVRDMIEQVLFTNPGERLNRPQFGSGLLQTVFAPNSDELAAALQVNILASLNQWLGDLIQVRNLEVANDDAKLHVVLDYLVTRSGRPRRDSFEGSRA